MKMGEIIRTLRLAKGLTQEELGKVIGVQKSAIRKYEAGKVENIKRSSIKKLADFFEVSPSYLMGLDSPADDLSPMDKIILAIFKNLSDEEKGEVILYANNIKNTNNKN